VAVAYIALGANLGNREENLRTALRGITRMARVEAVSSLYETEPEGPFDAAQDRPPQPKYYNAVCRIETGLSAQSLLRFLQGLEHEIGRRPTGEAMGPRVIDLDLLLYDDRTIDDAGLVVPHPRMAGRAFVMAPLAEIAPEVVVGGRTAGESAGPLGRDGVDVVADAGWDGVVASPQDVLL
jgi:2-amino-4-hydroxy-6-hydroxymethyldihydropteridine diphosphokinase